MHPWLRTIRTDVYYSVRFVISKIHGFSASHLNFDVIIAFFIGVIKKSIMMHKARVRGWDNCVLSIFA